MSSHSAQIDELVDTPDTLEAVNLKLLHTVNKLNAIVMFERDVVEQRVKLSQLKAEREELEEIVSAFCRQAAARRDAALDTMNKLKKDKEALNRFVEANLKRTRPDNPPPIVIATPTFHRSSRQKFMLSMHRKFERYHCHSYWVYKRAVRKLRELTSEYNVLNSRMPGLEDESQTLKSAIDREVKEIERLNSVVRNPPHQIYVEAEKELQEFRFREIERRQLLLIAARNNNINNNGSPCTTPSSRNSDESLLSKSSQELPSSILMKKEPEDEQVCTGGSSQYGSWNRNNFFNTIHNPAGASDSHHVNYKGFGRNSQVTNTWGGLKGALRAADDLYGNVGSQGLHTFYGYPEYG